LGWRPGLPLIAATPVLGLLAEPRCDIDSSRVALTLAGGARPALTFNRHDRRRGWP